MDNEETIQRLAARYVAAYRAGLQPQLSEYLSRYPQYAGTLVDFVSYYHAMEVDLPIESETIAPLSQTSRAAYDEAMEKMAHEGVESGATTGSLRMAASNAYKSFEQVSIEAGLGQDVLQELDQRRIDISTIPREVSRRLAKALHQPVASLEILLGMGKQEQHVQLVAEQHPRYDVEVQPALHARVYSFQEAIEKSARMSGEQKAAWRAVLLQEGLL